jgi:hypothetical protein
MKKSKTLEEKITRRISLAKGTVFLRKDFADLGNYNRVGQILRRLTTKGKVIRAGYGIYAKAKISPISGQLVPCIPLPSLAREALSKLGRETGISSGTRDYNSGKSTQVPTGRLIAVKGRISRKIGYKGFYVSYEPLSQPK